MPVYAIGVDLGGTHLRVGAVRSDGTIEIKEKLPAEAKKGEVLSPVADAVKRIADQISKKGGTIAGVGLGFPGIVDPEQGIVYQSPHFPDWNRLDLHSFFKREFRWPIVIDNDANMAARGEGRHGAARGLKNFILLTLGTGVGGGIVANGEVFHGDGGFAGEVGHLVIEGDGASCPCGGKGCLEMYVSATGILRLVEESEDRRGREQLLGRVGLTADQSYRLTVASLYEAAREGDLFAHLIFKKMGSFLGIGLVSLINILGIETVILGGGVSQAWDFFIEPAKKEFSQRTYKETARRLKILRAELGDDAGLIGASGLLFQKSQKDR